MICPFTDANKHNDYRQCHNDCALRMRSVYHDDTRCITVRSYTCAIAAIACNINNANFTPRADDASVELVNGYIFGCDE